MHEYWTKVPYLLNQVSAKMDGDIKKGWWEIYLKITYDLKQVLF